VNLIENATGYPALPWSVTRLRNGEQVTLVDVDIPNKQVMVESLRTGDVWMVPLSKTNLKLEQ